ncbi:MAG: shikimate kinase [Prevotellaceae bacterium]|jgi:shikimate kinase|nr:shikimate kinase [Prevotellaceae bacterium]
MNGKKHVAIIGMPGSGKSTAGLILSKLMRLPFIDTDCYIIQREGKTVAEIFAKHGEARFRELEKQALLEIIEGEPAVISTGGGMPCFHSNMELINGFALSIYLEASPQKLFEHLKRDKKRPLVAGKTDGELRDYINTCLEQRRQYYEKADITVHVGDTPTALIAANLYDTISLSGQQAGR